MFANKMSDSEHWDMIISPKRNLFDLRLGELWRARDPMEAVRGSDCVIIVTNHKPYDYKAILEAAKFIFDSRNALEKMGKDNPKVVRL